MSSTRISRRAKVFALGLDWWAVLASLATALLVKFGILKSIPW